MYDPTLGAGGECAGASTRSGLGMTRTWRRSAGSARGERRELGVSPLPAGELRSGGTRPVPIGTRACVFGARVCCAVLCCVVLCARCAGLRRKCEARAIGRALAVCALRTESQRGERVADARPSGGGCRRHRCVIDAGRQQIGRLGLSLSGSWQQGHSAAYSTPSFIRVVCRGSIGRGRGTCDRARLKSKTTLARGSPRPVRKALPFRHGF